jgi:Ca-activated chloride channel family protein
MRSFMLVALAASVCAAVDIPAPAAAQQPEGQTPIFREAARIVPVITTVTDNEGRLVPGLEKEDFSIFDNGKLQETALFLSTVEPFSVVVMLDKSASMTANLDRLTQAAEQFLLRMLPLDKAQVGAFSDKIEFSGEFTSDRDGLIAALKDLQFGNPTRLYDAINASMAALTTVDGRKVVLVFTDGDDTASRMGAGDVVQRAREEDVMIYAIGLQSEFFNGQSVVRTRPDRGLKRVAEETGGGYFELTKTADLAPTFTRVAQELHSQYILGFTPTVLDGKEHKLQVRLRGAGMTARARRSYIADADRLGDSR